MSDAFGASDAVSEVVAKSVFKPAVNNLVEIPKVQKNNFQYKQHVRTIILNTTNKLIFIAKQNKATFS